MLYTQAQRHWAKYLVVFGFEDPPNRKAGRNDTLEQIRGGHVTSACEMGEQTDASYLDTTSSNTTVW